MRVPAGRGDQRLVRLRERVRLLGAALRLIAVASSGRLRVPCMTCAPSLAGAHAPPRTMTQKTAKGNARPHESRRGRGQPLARAARHSLRVRANGVHRGDSTYRPQPHGRAVSHGAHSILIGNFIPCDVRSPHKLRGAAASADTGWHDEAALVDSYSSGRMFMRRRSSDGHVANT
jgi:hypothetical protein